MDTGSDSNLMPFKIFKILFPKSTLAAQCATKITQVILRTYIQSDIGQLGVCTVRLRHKDKNAGCRFFVVWEDVSTLLT